VVNAGSNPAPGEIQDFLLLLVALSYLINSVVCNRYFVYLMCHRFESGFHENEIAQMVEQLLLQLVTCLKY